MRLIDADALNEKLESLKNRYAAQGRTQVAEDYIFIQIVLGAAPTIDAVTYSQISNVIAGHSNYHGEDILAALTCIAEGKDVKPVKPIDAVAVVRCRECKHGDLETMHCDHPMGTTMPVRRKPNDYCSYGERREVE